uniref:Actin-related protein 8 n=1 Tax=Cacopsylla melanoneura TaxID=428564 RepID=A0A8D8VG47_9HEMI
MVLNDSISDELSSQNQHVIVIHPGSLYVRISRASDVNPHTELHAVARKRLLGGAVHRDTLLPSTLQRPKECMQELEECRLQVSYNLQSCFQSSGQRRYATPPQQIAAFNRRSHGQVISTTTREWIKPEDDAIIGDEILNLNPSLDFNIHFPLQRGELNVHNGVGGSLTSVLTDLYDIWTHIIKTKLLIPIKDLQKYKAVLVIPDIYNRLYLKEYMYLLLHRMGFSACFLIQDHVVATFGAGLGYACVIDVGHTKTSVSCVEDGVSISNTRVRLGYGGGDITQAYHWLLQKCAFPYKCDPNLSTLDAILLQKLKHDFCHVNLDVCGCFEKSFIVRQPKKPATSFVIQVADECLIAPLGIFHPELLGLTGIKPVFTQSRAVSDSEDPHDGDYLRETSVSYRRGTKESGDPGDGMGGDGGASLTLGVGGGGGEEDIVVDSMVEVCSSADFVLESGQPLGLDQAVLQSVERCGGDEQKRKMYSTILIVGGGLKFDGISHWLQSKLALHISYANKPDQIDIITTPKESDPQITTWRGAAILSSLETAQELWITADEWKKHSVTILRERAPFMW